MNLLLLRTCFHKESTSGVLLLNDKFFCYTLEDTVRRFGVKIPGKTAIPSGRYRVIVTMSLKFGRKIPLINDVPGFSGVRFHGGNTVEDTEGCPLVAYNRLGDSLIQGTAEKKLTKYLKAESVNYLHIVNVF